MMHISEILEQRYPKYMQYIATKRKQYKTPEKTVINVKKLGLSTGMIVKVNVVK